jgi:hypothetical protein
LLGGAEDLSVGGASAGGGELHAERDAAPPAALGDLLGAVVVGEHEGQSLIRDPHPKRSATDTGDRS